MNNDDPPSADAVSVDASTVISPGEASPEADAHLEVAEVRPPEWNFRRVQETLSRAGYDLGETVGRHEKRHVHTAFVNETGESVVAKILVEPQTSQKSAIARFHREARTLKNVRHPNLVRILDYGSESDVHFIIFEFLAGDNLGDRVLKGGPLTTRQAISCVKQAGLALAALHRSGVIHRDVKPSNLVRMSDGSIKLIDLGLALVSEPADASITRLFDDRVLGTADYMSPEQAQDCHQVDQRADIYSLGCTLYFLLAGRAPFFGDTLAARLMEHRLRAPPSLALERSLPEQLVAACLKMMAKRPEDRFQSALEVVEELRQCPC